MAYTKTVWKDYPDTTTKMTAQKLNNIEDGIAAAHTILGSATSTDLTKLHALTADATELNYVDGVTSAIQTQFNTLKTYSTSETAVGLWIGGETIYRRVFTGTMPYGSGWQTLVSGVTFSKIISINGWIAQSATENALIPSAEPGFTVHLNYSYSSSLIRANLATNWSGSAFTLIVEYLKRK